MRLHWELNLQPKHVPHQEANLQPFGLWDDAPHWPRHGGHFWRVRSAPFSFLSLSAMTVSDLRLDIFCWDFKASGVLSGLPNFTLVLLKALLHRAGKVT